MAVDMFLKVSGIDGESTDKQHKGTIEVLSFSWGVSNASRRAGTSRLSAGKTQVSDFSIMKYIDTASPRLFESCCQGQHLHEAMLTVRKAGETQQEFLKITLNDVLISSVAPGGAAGGDQPLEQVSFSFGSATLQAAKVDPKGQAEWTSATTCGGSSPELEEIEVNKK
jgi:type VI secretion system secreted protein Hcp